MKRTRTTRYSGVRLACILLAAFGIHMEAAGTAQGDTAPSTAAPPADANTGAAATLPDAGEGWIPINDLDIPAAQPGGGGGVAIRDLNFPGANTVPSTAAPPADANTGAAATLPDAGEGWIPINDLDIPAAQPGAGGGVPIRDLNFPVGPGAAAPGAGETAPPVPPPAAPAVGNSAPVGTGGMDAAAMLAAHNQWRSRYGVPPLQWSGKLTDVAQQWADHLASTSCSQGHSGNSYGENIFFATAVMWSDGRREIKNKTAQEVVDSWGNEVKDYEYANNSCHYVCGHYTQVVWRDTREVGCAMAICGDKSQLWVCNYFPAGNVIGQKPY